MHSDKPCHTVDRCTEATLFSAMQLKPTSLVLNCGSDLEQDRLQISICMWERITTQGASPEAILQAISHDVL